MDIDLAIKYITGEIQTFEKEKFETWLLLSKENSEEFAEFKKTWEATGRAFQNFEPNVVKAWKIVKKDTVSAPKTKPLPKTKQLYTNILKLAASIAIIIGVSFLARITFNWMQKEELITYSSSKYKMIITLADGSNVWLNAESSITVPREFKGNKRKVYLKGKAFFEVTKNPERPFVIEAKHTLTTVLGTSFYLNANNDDSIVTLAVVTGKVSFEQENNLSEKLILVPGDKGSIDVASNKSELGKNQDPNFLAWKTGKIRFEDAQMEEVCKVLTEYYKIRIEAGNLKGNQDYSFSGNFDNKPLTEVLSIIELTLNIKFVKNEHSFIATQNE